MKHFILMLLVCCITSIGCDKDSDQHACYDAALVHNDPCTKDCPGFLGCDGETYCNECEAARIGIGPN